MTDNLPPGVTNAMMDHEILDEDWEKLMDWLVGSGMTPAEIRAAVEESQNPDPISWALNSGDGVYRP